MDMPGISETLVQRMAIVRRDIGNLLFHFTRRPDGKTIAQIDSGYSDAEDILRKILEEGKLRGSSNWIRDKEKCICFTEAPIHEFAAIFSLNKIAVNKKERPRYEPYGIAVGKDWLYKEGGRPVIYDSEEVYNRFPKDLRYRHVPFDPQKGIDYTWEREWRICRDELLLDPEKTLVVVPDARTAFDIAYSFSEEDASTQSVGMSKKDSEREEGSVRTFTREPKWMTVSLDLFDIRTSDLSTT